MHAHHTVGFVELEPLAIAGIDLVWVIVGLLCLMILFGFWVIATLLNDLFGSFSIFGFHPFGFAQGLLSGIMKKEAAWLDQKAKGLGHFLWSLIMMIWRFTYVAVATMTGLWEQHVLGQNAQDANVANETQRATNRENQLAQQEQTDFHNLQVSIQGNFTTLEGVIAQNSQVLQGEIATIQAEIANLGPGDDVALRAELQSDVAGLQNQINQQAASFANQLAAEQSSLTNQLAQVETLLEQQITNGVNTAEQFATGLFAGVGVGGIAQTLQSLSQRLSAVETETAECLDPLCDTVTPNAQRAGRNLNFLKNLEALGFEAALFALAAECLTDPQAVVDDVSTVVNDVGVPIMDAGKALIGL